MCGGSAPSPPAEHHSDRVLQAEDERPAPRSSRLGLLTPVGATENHGRRPFSLFASPVNEARIARRLKSERSPTLAGQSEVGLTVRPPSLEQEPTPQRPASQPYELSVAEFRKSRDKA
jgi:hypothetical protein